MATPSNQPPREIVDMECPCGRGRPHCHFCGSKNVYAKRTSGYTTLRGVETVFVMGYTCRTCGRLYHADSPCTAPTPKVPGQRAQNRAEGHSDDYSPEEAKKQVDPEAVRALIEGLKQLRPERYGNLKAPSAEGEEDNTPGSKAAKQKELPPTSTEGDDFFGRR